MNLSAWWKPKTMAGQMMVVLFLSLTLLLITFVVMEFLKQQTVSETAESSQNLKRIKSLIPVFEILNMNQVSKVLKLTSSCHAGHTLTKDPYQFQSVSNDTKQLENRISHKLVLEDTQVLVGHVTFSQKDFSYHKCGDNDMQFPLEGLVISIKLASGLWFNSEVHYHESHQFTDIIYWRRWSFVAAFFIGIIAVFLISHLNKPLENLNKAALEFAQGLKISKVKEIGPPDLRRTIKSFNLMQQQVSDEIDRRTKTLAAISHDIRTPITALRIKAELIEDDKTRESIISSIIKMEKITASGLEFLKGENRFEPMKMVDLSSLLESECFDFSEVGLPVSYTGESNVFQLCRPEALARAVRNLIENAVKYGGGAVVNLISDIDFVTISVSDNGPGIPHDKLNVVVQPFQRLSKARESNGGGFGLGLAITKAIIEGHNSQLSLEQNNPTGLVANILLTRTDKHFLEHYRNVSVDE